MTDWLSTRDVAERLGYRHLTHLRKLLVGLEIPFRRLTPRSPLRWHWPTIELRIVPRETVSHPESMAVSASNTRTVSH